MDKHIIPTLKALSVATFTRNRRRPRSSRNRWRRRSSRNRRRPRSSRNRYLSLFLSVSRSLPRALQRALRRCHRRRLWAAAASTSLYCPFSSYPWFQACKPAVCFCVVAFSSPLLSSSRSSRALRTRLSMTYKACAVSHGMRVRRGRFKSSRGRVRPCSWAERGGGGAVLHKLRCARRRLIEHDASRERSLKLLHAYIQDVLRKMQCHASRCVRVCRGGRRLRVGHVLRGGHEHVKRRCRVAQGLANVFQHVVSRRRPRGAARRARHGAVAEQEAARRARHGAVEQEARKMPSSRWLRTTRKFLGRRAEGLT